MRQNFGAKLSAVCDCVGYRCNKCVCVCVCGDGSFLQAELPSSSSCWVCAPRLASPRHASPGIVGFLNASECFGSSFSAKHEAEHHCIPLFPLSAAPVLVGAFVVVGVSVVSVVAVVVVVVIAAPVAAKFVCCFLNAIRVSYILQLGSERVGL